MTTLPRPLNVLFRLLLQVLLLAALFTGSLWVAEALRHSGVIERPTSTGRSVYFTSEPDPLQLCVDLGRECRN